LEQKFARHVQVWRALAHAAWDKEPRIRRLRKCIELSHDLWAYETLAGIYRQDHRYDEWLAVLNESLTRPSRGLEHDRVRSQIAGYYMLHNEWEKALPYAVEAAGSWAEWAMLGAADCYEGLGDDENEGRWRARMAERYPSPANSMALYHWARRSGLGDAESLAGQLDPVVADWAENNAPSGQHGVGIFYQLSGRPRQALAAYQKATNDRSNLQFAYTAQLRLALVALELGDVRAREEALKALRAIRDPALADFQRLGAWLEQELARPIEEPPDLAAVRKTIAEAASNHRPSLNFAVGRFLELRDRGEEAEPFLDAAASSAESHKMLSRVLASAALRDRGATPSKLKTEPIPFEKPEQRPSGGGQGPASEK
jgi:tetratricopeptide (TPR) repeat protein